MATTIEILLRSEFDSSGFNAAQAKAEELVAGIKAGATGLSGETFIENADALFPTGEAAKFSAQMSETAERLKEYAVLAAEIDPELARKINAQRKAASGLSQEFAELASLTRTQVFKEFTRAGQSISQMATSLKAAAAAEKQFAIAARESRQFTKAEIHERRLAAIEREINAINRLTGATTELTAAQRLFGNLSEQFENVSGIAGFENRIEQLREHYDGLRESAIEAGDAAGIEEAVNALADLESIEGTLFGINNQFEQFGKQSDFFGPIINSQFNQLGFTLFITLNTFKSLINIVTSIRDAFIEATNAADRFTTFFGALQTGTANARELDEQIRSAAAGFVELQTAQEGAIKLSLAFGGSQSDLAAQLLEISKLIDITTGGVFNATDTYNTLVEAIETGNAAALDGIPGFEGISDAVELAKLNAEQAKTSFNRFDESSLTISLLTQRTSELAVALGQTGVAVSSARESLAELEQQTANLGLAWDLIKVSAVESILGIANSLTGLKSTTDEAMAFLVATIGNAFEIIALLLRTWWTPITTLVESGIKGWSALLEAFALAMEGDFRGAVSRIADFWVEDNPISVGIENTQDSWNTFIDNTETGSLRAFESFGLIETGATAAAAAIGALANNAQNIENAFDFGPAIQQLKLFTGATGQFIKSLNRATEDFNQAMADIDADFGGQITDLETDLRQLQGIDLSNLGNASEMLNLLADSFDNVAAGKLADAIEDFNKNIADLEEDLAIKLGDIDEDLNDKRNDIMDDAQDKRERATKKHNKKMEDIEEDHQKKINEINKRFELARLKALIDRDARALFEAERRRDEDLRKAKEAAEEKRRDEEERARDEQNRINEQEAEKLADAEKAAERRRRDAQRQAERRRRDLEEQLEEERETILEGLEDEIEALEKQWQERKAATEKEFKRRIDRMKKDFEDQRNLEKSHGLLQEAILLDNMKRGTAAFDSGFDAWETEFNDFIPELEGFVLDIEELVRRIPDAIPIPNIGTPGGGSPGGPPPPPGGGGGPCSAIADIGEVFDGEPCAFIPANRTFTAPDCSKWHCAGGFWRPGPAPTGGASVQTTSNTTQGVQLNGTGGQTEFMRTNGTANQIPVQIVVENDKTLETIFSEMAYSAFIRVMEE